MNTSIPFSVNGEQHSLPLHSTLAQLIESLALSGKRLAIERNGTIVPRSQYASTALLQGDCIEIVQAIGGG